MTPSTIPAERVGAKNEKKKTTQKTEEAHINIGESPTSYKKCRVQSKLKLSMQNFNALWHAGPFEVDRWMQKHELNIKGSIKMLDSQSFGGCKGGINQFLCQAGGATPAVLVVSRQTKTASQTPDSGPALRKCLLFLKKHSSQTPRGLKCMQTTDLTFNERTCTAL